LLCGEDYQGYSIINLSNSKIYTYFPEDGYNGTGFCWAAVYPSKDSLTLAVDGCYWACPYDLVLYDFNNPDIVPLKELNRISDITDTSGWENDQTFIVTKEVVIRKSDGVLYELLNQSEQDILDKDDDLIDYRYDKYEISSTNITKVKAAE
jgi:hypothetical protein